MSAADNQNQEIAAAAAAKEPGVGRLLRQAREARNLSLEDMARHLRLSVRQVTALEEDDHDKLSGDVFLRGFIRNYARFVDLDASPLLAKLSQSSPQSVRRTISTPIEGIPFPSGQKQARLNLVIVAVVIGIAGFLGYEIYTGRQAVELQSQPATMNAPEPDEPESSADATAVMTEARIEAETVAQQEGVPLPQQTEAGQTVVALQTPAPAVLSDAPVPPFPVISAPANTAVPGQPAAAGVTSGVQKPGGSSSQPEKQVLPPAVPVVTGQGDATIHFTFTTDSWVEVRDAGKKIVFSQFNQRNTEQVVRGKAPFSLTVGNAPGVKLVYNNRLIDLAPHTRDRVAHVVLD